MSDNKREQMLSKVRKLLALANDSRGNQQERDNALRQANKLMAVFNIQEADVTLEAMQRVGIDLAEFTAKPNGSSSAQKIKHPPKWSGVLAAGVAIFTETRCVFKWDFIGVVVAFQGERTDALFAQWLFILLAQSIQKELAATGLTSQSHKDTFRFAAAAHLQDRLKTLANERDRMYEESGSGTALAVVNQKKSAIADRFGEDKMQRVSAGKRPNRDAAFLGAAAGRRINIPAGRPIDADPTRERIGHGN